jgi:hypothetical protein
MLLAPNIVSIHMVCLAKPGAPVLPEVIDGSASRYFLFRAYLSHIAGQGSFPQASAAESSLCSRLQQGAANAAVKPD